VTQKTATDRLFDAIKDGNLENAKAAIAAGLEVNAKSMYGFAPLHIAAANGCTDIVRLLIAHGADVNAMEETAEWTPLYCAVWSGHTDAARLLIENGAKVNVIGDYGKPLHVATSYGLTDIVRLLISHGADVNAKDGDGRPPLCHATTIQNYDDAIARLLIEKGADVNAKDANGATPLHRAAWENRRDVARLLIDNGADINALDAQARTPRDIAKAKGYPNFVEMLDAASKGGHADRIDSRRDNSGRNIR
jgi:ankyrin repeat protein